MYPLKMINLEITMDIPKLTALIIEDDLSQQELLISIIEDQHPEIIIAGSCSSGAEALSTLRTIRPDLLFMDIDLGDMTAFDVLEHLKEFSFQIIFTTAYNAYALQAFKIHAVDFLLKPIDPEELKLAIQKALNSNGAHLNYKNVIDDFRMIKNRYLKIKIAKSLHFLPYHALLYAKQQPDGTSFYLLQDKNRKSIHVPQALRDFELELTAKDFIRISENCLIHPEQLAAFDTEQCKLKLQCGDLLDVDPDRRWLLEW